MRLYDTLDWLHPTQVCYCDTDSGMFVYDKNNKEHKEPTNENTEALDLVKVLVSGRMR